MEPKEGDAFICRKVEEFDATQYEHLQHDSVHFETLNGELLWVGFNHDGKSYCLVPKDR